MNIIVFIANSLQTIVTTLTMSFNKQLNLHLCYAMWHLHRRLVEFTIPLKKIMAKKYYIDVAIYIYIYKHTNLYKNFDKN